MSSEMQSSSDKKDFTEEELMAELEAGRELVRKGKHSEASEKLSAVLQKYVEKYGDMAVECADAWLRKDFLPQVV
jgi:hypothetical protein